MTVILNNSLSGRVLSTVLPAVIISMIFGYLIFNLAQVERVFNKADKHIQAEIDLQKSIIFLEKIRSLEKIMLDTSEKELNKEMLSGAVDELKELVFEKLNAVSFFYKIQVYDKKQIKFKEVIKQVDRLFYEPLENLAIVIKSMTELSLI